jgi:hypothetical protein
MKFLISILIVLLFSCSSYQTLSKSDRIRVIDIKRNAGKYGEVVHILKDRFGNNSWCLIKFDNSKGLSGVPLVNLIKVEK